MTAKGKINASKLEAGMRIIVEVLEDGRIRESSRKTGENVRIVKVETKHFRAASGPYERRGKYVIGTSLGQFEAATIQTMFLAPEDAAGVKRAHVEALAENAEREIEEKEAHQNTAAYRHFEEAVYAGGSYRAAMDILHAEALEMFPVAIGDTVIRKSDGAAYTVKEISPVNIILHGIGNLAVCGVTPDRLRDFFEAGHRVRDNGDGTYLVDGVSVGSPEVQPCGCPGAAGVTIGRTEDEDTCVRCGRNPYARR